MFCRRNLIFFTVTVVFPHTQMIYTCYKCCTCGWLSLSIFYTFHLIWIILIFSAEKTRHANVFLVFTFTCNILVMFRYLQVYANIYTLWISFKTMNFYKILWGQFLVWFQRVWHVWYDWKRNCHWRICLLGYNFVLGV